MAVVFKPLNERRIAIVSTAALNVRSDAVYQPGATDYRVIPGDIDPGEVVMSHVSVNFDRTGFQQDLNICFPIQRLHELADEGVIGSVAAFHYTVSGAPHPSDLSGLRSRHHPDDEGGRRRHRPAGANMTEVHARRGRAGH